GEALALLAPGPLEVPDGDALAAHARHLVVGAADGPLLEGGDVQEDEGQDHGEQPVLQPLAVAPHEAKRHDSESPSWKGPHRRGPGNPDSIRAAARRARPRAFRALRGPGGGAIMAAALSCLCKGI